MHTSVLAILVSCLLNASFPAIETQLVTTHVGGNTQKELSATPASRAAVAQLIRRQMDGDEFDIATDVEVTKLVREHGAQPVLAALIESLGADNVQVRRHAADVIVRQSVIDLESITVISHLIQSLRDPDPFVQDRIATYCLRAYDEVPVEYLFRELVKRLESENARERAGACIAAGVKTWLSDDQRSTLDELLKKRLSDVDGVVRVHAAVALSQWRLSKTENVIPVLIEAMHDSAAEVRWRAARALDFPLNKSDGVQAALTAAMDDQSGLVRIHAFKSLPQSKQSLQSSILNGMVETLRHPDELTRLEAVDAIGQIRQKPSDLVPALIERLDDESLFVRRSAAWTLSVIGPDAIKSLLESLTSDRPRVRTGTAMVLGTMYLERHAKNRSGWYRYEVRDLAPFDEQVGAALVKQLQDSQWQVRREAALALSAVGPSDKVVTELARSAENDEDENVRESCVAALSARGPGTTAIVAAPIVRRIVEHIINDFTSADWITVERAQNKLESLQERAIPALLDLMNQDRRVELHNTMDLIYPGAKKFYGHGYIVDYDIDWLPVRAGWVLEQIAFRKFGFAESAIRHDELLEATKNRRTDRPLSDVVQLEKNDEIQARKRLQAIKHAKAWWAEVGPRWTRYGAVLDALRRGDETSQVEVIRWLRSGKTTCDGLTLETFVRDIVPEVRKLATSDNKSVREQSQRLLKDTDNGRLKPGPIRQ